MRVIRLAAIILLLSFLGLALAVGSAWSDLNTAVPHHAAGKVINIPLGDAPDQVVALLQRNGVIANSWPLRLYIKLTARGKLLKAGDYMFDSPISPLEVLKKLENGEQCANKLTIVEGWTRWDIANAMVKIPSFKLSSPNDALRLLADTRAIEDMDKQATSLEGYIFPETYFVLSNSKPAEIIGEAVSQFKRNWKKELEPLARAQEASAHAIVIVASIIETEAKLKEERPIIASVIYNRLARKMPLGMDSTIVYAAKIAGKWRDDGKVYQSDIDRDSPYNTRKNSGLPIGPVGNPGLSSLKAALQPAKTDYLYYVRNPARNDGAHNFYSNEAQFDEGVQALRNWEKQRDATHAALAAQAVRHPSPATIDVHGQQANGQHSPAPVSNAQSPAQSSPVHSQAAAHSHPGASLHPAANSHPATNSHPAANSHPALHKHKHSKTAHR